MFNPATAILWEFWRQGRWRITVNAISAFSVPALIYGISGIDRELLAQEPLIAHLLFGVFFAVTIFLIVGNVCHATGSNKRLYTLPISVWEIVGWRMLTGTVVTMGAYLLIALALNLSLKVDWPLAKPAISAGAACAWCQVLVWSVGTVERLRSVAISLSTITITLLATIALFSLDPGFLHRASTWHTAILIIQFPAAYLVAVFLTARARRGEEVSFDVFREVLRRLRRLAMRRADLAGPWAAEAWRDWVEKGAVVPMAAAGGASLAVIYTFALWMLGENANGTLPGGSVFWVAVSPLVGLFVGHCGERFDIHSFKATRPLSDTQLADIILWNCARAVALSWLAIGVAACVIWIGMLVSGGQAAPREFFRDWPGNHGGWLTMIGLSFLAAAGLAVLNWTCISLGANASVVRGPALMWSLNGGTVMLLTVFVARVHMPPGPNDILQQALNVGFVVGVTLATVAIFAVAIRLRLVSPRRVLLAVCLYALTCLAGFTVLWTSVSPEEWLLPVLLLLSLSMLPWMPLAGLPLAMWWNRHR